MSATEINLLHIVHIASALMLVGYTFLAFAAAPERRKQVMMLSGIAALLLLLTGLRMWQGEFGLVLAGWVIVKIICLLGIAAIGGVGFRRREITGTLAVVTLLLGTIAIAMAVLKPF
jgi:hypothetical protein